MLLAANLLAYNAERYLERCLASITPWVDEIVVGLDDKTTDKTEAILKKHGVCYSPFRLRRFDAARNRLIRQTRSAWIFSIDTDETILAAHGPLLKELAQRGDAEGIDAWVLNTRNWFDLEMTREDAGRYPDPHIRLFKKRRAVRWDGRVHEGIIGERRAENAHPLEIQHFNLFYRDEVEWERVNQFYSDLDA